MEGERLAQRSLALAQRQAGQVVAVELEQVEEVEEDRDAAQPGQPGVVDAHPPLQALEARPRALEGDDLAVGEEVGGGLGLQRLDQLRVGGAHAAAGA